MTAQDCLDRLKGVRSGGTGRWLARCPAHPDQRPSLSIRERTDRILVHCFAGCTPEEIAAAIGLSMRDLFITSSVSQEQRPRAECQQMTPSALAFQFELAALDRRLRAERVLNAVAAFSGDGMEDEERDRLMTAIAGAYHDQGRAEFLETMADVRRWSAYQERTAHHEA